MTVDPLADVVCAELVESSAGIKGGNAQTSRFDNLSDARAGYRDTMQTLHACPTFTTSKSTLSATETLTVTDQRNRLDRSDVSFTMTGLGGVTVRSTITRYANTVTWIAFGQR